MGDFNARLYSNFLRGLSDHIGQYAFSTTIDEEHYPQTNLSHRRILDLQSITIHYFYRAFLSSFQNQRIL